MFKNEKSPSELGLLYILYLTIKQMPVHTFRFLKGATNQQYVRLCSSFCRKYKGAFFRSKKILLKW